MARVTLTPTTSATVSAPFVVGAGESLAVVTSGLTGSATIVVQAYNGVDFADLSESSATITATSISTNVGGGGLYRLRKSESDSPAGAVVGYS